MHPADHPLVSERYFFPRPDAPPSNLRVDVSVEGASLACGHADAKRSKTLLHFHGNGEVVADYLPGFDTLLASMGYDSFFAEYRGYGASSGRPMLSAMLDDVPAIIKAAGGPESLVVFGRSIGSIYAIECAYRFPSIAGLIIESGIHNVLERILLRVSPSELGFSIDEVREAFTARFDHRAKLASYKGPCLLLHARGDDLVLPEHAHHNAEAHGGATELRILPHGDHNSIFAANRDSYVAALRDFLAGVEAPGSGIRRGS